MSTLNLPTLSSNSGAAVLPPPSNFTAYARAVQRFPVLEEEEERQLVKAWRTHQDRSAAWRLVMSHLRLVVKVVRAQSGYGLPPGDLAQEGTVGLMKAVHRFDPARGVRLGVYALKWIEAEIREFIMRNWRLVRMNTSAGMKKLFFGYRKALAHLRQWGEERETGPILDEVAQAMDLSPDQVALARSYFNGADVSLIGPEDNDRDDLMLLAGDHQGADPAHVLEEEDWGRAQRAHLQKGLARLDPRERAIVEARHLREKPIGLVELGTAYGVSAERVRQIEKRALKKMME